MSVSPAQKVVRHNRQSFLPKHLSRTQSFLKSIPKEKGINEKERSACRELYNKLLAAIEANLPFTEEEVEGILGKSYENAMTYKNRPLATCSILHFAIWYTHVSQLHKELKDETGASVLVKRMLQQNADLHAYATYITEKDGRVYETNLEPIHIAAGIGSIPAMEALLQAHVAAGGSAEEYLATCATICEYGRDEYKFYCPIHDAAYLGQKDAVIWLLEKKADASVKNKDGCTALHFVALIAGSSLVPSDQDVQELVQTLLDKGAALDEEAKSFGPTDPYPAPAFLQNKMPLDIAVATQYPPSQLHLLAPSIMPKNNEPCLFDDMMKLAEYSVEAAEHLSTELLHRAMSFDEARLRQLIVLDAQKPGQVDRFAKLLFLVPRAAANLLDILTVEPDVQDVGKHNIPGRTLLQNGPMKCTNREDCAVVPVEIGENLKRSVRWPQWKFDAKGSKKPDWHSRFLPRIEYCGRNNQLYEVRVVALLLPDVLDVDVLMALNRIWEPDRNIFGRIPVQGIICCLWDNLVWKVHILEHMYTCIEFLALIFWGLSEVPATSCDKFTNDTMTCSGVQKDASNLVLEQNSHMHFHFCKIILLAGFFRDLFLGVWWFLAHYSKWFKHDDKTMKSLWELKNFGQTLLFSRGLFLLVRGLLMWHVQGEGVMSDVCQALLAFDVLIQGFHVVLMVQFAHVGRRILVLFKAGATNKLLYMTAITLWLFMSIMCAIRTIIGGERNWYIAAYLYRGLVAGDGDAMDKLGLRAQSVAEYTDKEGFELKRVFLGVFVLGGTILFNTAILNLLTAIYSNEYEEIEKGKHLMFLEGRSKYCLKYIIMMHRGCLQDMLSTLLSQTQKILTMLDLAVHKILTMLAYLFPQAAEKVKLYVGCLRFLLIVYQPQDKIDVVSTLAYLFPQAAEEVKPYFACLQFFLIVYQPQDNIDFFSTEVGLHRFTNALDTFLEPVNPFPKFAVGILVHYWLLFFSILLAFRMFPFDPLFGALLVSCLQIREQFAYIQADWFKPDIEWGQASSEPDRFLWICHRSDFDTNYVVGRDMELESLKHEMNEHFRVLDHQHSHFKTNHQSQHNEFKERLRRLEEKLDQVLAGTTIPPVSRSPS